MDYLKIKSNNYEIQQSTSLRDTVDTVIKKLTKMTCFHIQEILSTQTLFELFLIRDLACFIACLRLCVLVTQFIVTTFLNYRVHSECVDGEHYLVFLMVLIEFE